MMSKDLPLIYELNQDEIRLTKMLKALGNPVRFGIMQYLAQRQVCITGDIVAFTTLAQSTVSQHLKCLKNAGLIQGNVEGPRTCYCLNKDVLEQFRQMIDRLNL